MSKASIFLKTFLFLFLFLFIGNTPKTLAQFQESDVTFRVSPTFPKPGESVDVKVSSYTVGLDKSFIVWSVNGQEKSSGIGKDTFSFNLDKFSTRTQVTASITLAGGATITKSTFVSSAEIDLLWEATDSYVPPFYKGKALGIREGNFKVVAIPSIDSSRGKVKPANLSYTWKKDGNAQVSASGFGKNGFSFKNSYLDRSNEISVEVEDIENKTKTGGKIIINGLEKPEIIFYKKDSKLGVLYPKALNDGYILSKEPETIVAVPYFFTPKNIQSSALRFDWSAGGEKINPNTLKNEVTVVPPDESGGTNLKVRVENVSSLFQILEKNINVSF